MSEKSIRASEVSEYVYCRRAWWMRRAGKRNDNVRQLVAGTQHHEAHGSLVRQVGRARLAFYILFALAIAAILVTLWQVL